VALRTRAALEGGLHTGTANASVALLTLRAEGRTAPPLSDPQIAELRAFSQLESVTVDQMEVSNAFDAPLGDEDRRLFNPPTQSPRLPHLAQFQWR